MTNNNQNTITTYPCVVCGKNPAIGQVGMSTDSRCFDCKAEDEANAFTESEDFDA